MTEINRILAATSHRPYALPGGNWQYYQEWNEVLFFHYKVPFEILRQCVPATFDLDTFGGDCYVSLVAFTMEKIRPRSLPSIGFISDFHEINLRTYINNDHKKGVYFLNIEAAKFLSVFIAKSLSGLPYEKAEMKRISGRYQSRNKSKGFYLDTEYATGDSLPQKTALDTWLSERYCLYLESQNTAYRYDIQHQPWELRQLEIKTLKLHYKVADLDLSDRVPDLVHFSKGVKVIAWGRRNAGNSERRRTF